jgi:adenine-specific DNA-methyltransferase
MILQKIFGKKDVFPYPKSLYAVKDILYLLTSSESVVLDFFAGSGTTLHAVAELNEGDNGNRTCVLVTNNEGGICRQVTQPRVDAVLSGKWKSGNQVALPGTMTFYRTDFAKRLKSPDRMRTEIARHTVDLVAVKESTARTVSQNATLAVLKGAAKTVAVVPSLDPDHAELRKVAEKKVEDGDKKIVYLFTWSDHGVEKEVAALWPGWEVNPLPAEMLAALRRLAPPARLFDDLGGVS